MTKRGDYVTTACTAHGHPEFTLHFEHDVPVAGLEKMLLAYFEGSVQQGVTFKPGQTVQLGWATLRLTQRADGTLGVLEPDLKHELKWIESVDQSIFETWRQKEVLESLGLSERANFPRQALQAIVCTKVWEATSFVLGRTEPSAPSDSGWFIGCGDDTHDHQHEDALTVIALIELAVRIPPLTQFLALPVGTDVIASGPERLRARVFIEEAERAPVPGSYLEALNAS